MTKSEALSLAAQLGIQLPKFTINNFVDYLSTIGLEVGIDNATGDWVILDRKLGQNQEPLARCK